MGVETARLTACDAKWDGSCWTRTEPFRFLFLGRLGHRFLLTRELSWMEVSENEARTIFAALPIRLLTEEEAFPAAGAENET